MFVGDPVVIADLHVSQLVPKAFKKGGKPLANRWGMGNVEGKTQHG